MRYGEPFLLSTTGSTRATAYGFANKSVTLDGKTHVVWLDAVAQVCARTYDHVSGTWGSTVRLFEGFDNHTTPTLTVDREHRLHMVWGPHGWWGGWNQGRFKWVTSERPNDIGAWTGEQDFGYNATYACMVHTPQDLDAIVYRGGEWPASLMFQRQRALGGWTDPRPLMHQEIAPQYTHVNASLRCSPDGTLYVGGHFYNVGGDFGGPDEQKRSRGAAVLRSEDFGETWTDLRGERVGVPTLLADRIAVPARGPHVYLFGLALDASADLWVLTGNPGMEERALLLSCWDGKRWDSVDLQSELPPDRHPVDAVVTIDRQNRVHICATALQPGRLIPRPDASVWGQPSNEVFHMVSRPGGGDWECAMVSKPGCDPPNWLPSISRGGVFCPVEQPVILYTHGDKGEGCSPETETEVWCIMVREE